MCGIVGLWSSKISHVDKLMEIGFRMQDSLTHRGPDDSGSWFDQQVGLGLLHRRLSILDLTAAGQQPMISHDGRFVIVYNGEIYNHLDIRREIEKQYGLIAWRGHSDTETLIEAISHWGFKQTLIQLVGMFAFAVWDSKERTLTLARDRFGEKPLYYGIVNGSLLLFASELKAFRNHPDFNAQINQKSLATFLRHGYIPSPHSIYFGVHKLSPGSFAKFSCQDENILMLVLEKYWNFKEIIRKGKLNLFSGTEAEAVKELDRLLRQSIRGQLLADVPVGAFLSGGIDSSTIVALMQQESSHPVQTFSIGFHEQEYNEAPYAQAVAKHLYTNHTSLYVTPTDSIELIPQISCIFDEPFADSSQIPTFLLSKLTRQHVTVSLSGDAGDELFGGYTRYMRMIKTWQRLKLLPVSLRKRIAKILQMIPDNFYDDLGVYLPQNLQKRIHSIWANKIVLALQADFSKQIYLGNISYWADPDKLILQANELETVYNTQSFDDNISFAEQMMIMDTLGYLIDDVLVKVDRTAMAVSLETRVPLLDHRIVEFAWCLPIEWKIHGNQGKSLLRKLLYHYVPQHLVERPKMGFGIPIGQWLREPLRDWAEDLLSDRALLASGFFDPRPIRKRWMEHLHGVRDWQYHLWIILMFQAWYKQYHSQ